MYEIELCGGAADLPNIQHLDFINSSTGFRHLVGCCGLCNWIVGQLGTGPPRMQGGRAHRRCSCWLASCPFVRSPCGRIGFFSVTSLQSPSEPCRALQSDLEPSRALQRPVQIPPEAERLWNSPCKELPPRKHWEKARF